MQPTDTVRCIHFFIYTCFCLALSLAVAERRLRLGIVTENTLSCLCSRLALPLIYRPLKRNLPSTDREPQARRSKQ